MEAIIFDAYGTLFDLDALKNDISQILGSLNADSISAVWQQKQMDYAWMSNLMGRYQDFDKLTEAALRFALLDNDIQPSEDTVRALMSAYLHVPLYPDVRPLFDRLENQIKLSILSNGTFKSLQTLTERAEILFSLDYLMSVEPIRMYKPARQPYQLALDTLKCDKSQIMFVSSNGWDVTGAKSFGFHTVWCNRKSMPFEQLGFASDETVSSLKDILK